MIPWLLAQAVFYNFCLGAMLPIVPALSPEHAGAAFSAFSVFKILYLWPAGRISDRIGHDRGLALTLVLQLVALSVIAWAPSALWAGRMIEGMALGQGTVSSVSLLRAASTEERSFGAAFGRLMAAGGLGFILGPIFAYALLSRGARVPLVALSGATAVFLAVQIAVVARTPAVKTASLARSARVDAARPVESAQARDAARALMVGLAAAKVLGIAWQPNLAWWAPHTMGFGATLSGLTFIVMGLTFSAGAARRPASFRVSSALVVGGGFLGLELALRGSPLAWWIAVPVLGWWFGAYVTESVALLGWNRPDRIGAQNSVWMMATDTPMALAPLLVWRWRDVEPSGARVIAEVALVLVAGACLAAGTRRRGAAPPPVNPARAAAS